MDESYIVSQEVVQHVEVTVRAHKMERCDVCLVTDVTAETTLFSQVMHYRSASR